MVQSGIVIVKNEAMKFLKFYATPMKFMTLETLVGIDHFMMASILA